MEGRTFQSAGVPARSRLAAAALGLLVWGCGDGPVTPASQGGLGIYSETAPRMRPDVDVFIGTFAGGGAVIMDFRRDGRERAEGSASLRSTVSAAGQGFAGWFVAWGDAGRLTDDGFTRDMSAYAAGSLRLWVRSPVDLEVGIRSGDIPAGGEASKVLLSRTGSFAPGPGWQRVCIPLSVLVGPAPRADLSRIKIMFVVAVNAATGGTGGAPATFWIDDVRWDAHPC